MPQLFDYVDAIMMTKENIMIDQVSENDYSPYMVNRALSQYSDTLWYAAELDRLYDIPKKQQFNFLLNIVPKRKRRTSWVKKVKDDDSVKLVMEYYKYSNEKAIQAMTVLSDADIANIRKKLNKGGNCGGDNL